MKRLQKSKTAKNGQACRKAKPLKTVKLAETSGFW
jgi:hypothetical protein